MKIFTYSQARASLSDILERSKKEEIIIRRRKGDLFSIVPKNPRKKSPFDIRGIRSNITEKEIISILRESRKRS